MMPDSPQKPLIFDGTDRWTRFQQWLKDEKHSQYFLLTDHNTFHHCAPVFMERVDIPLTHITLPAGEAAKHLGSVQIIWDQLYEKGADRRSLLINLGGGMITDIGGFAAATFKRGLPFANIPTSLLAQVDAALGGKTGIDYHSGKNIIGVFASPEVILSDHQFLTTLPEPEWLSGLAEIIKHGLIADVDLFSALESITDVRQIDPALINRAAAIKNGIVDQDPMEKGLRKVLNFGHTLGHALESMALEAGKPIRHGEAVAVGMLMEGWLSYKVAGLSEGSWRRMAEMIGRFFETSIPVSDTQILFKYLRQDKKNHQGEIRMVLLKDIGEPRIDQVVSNEWIEEVIKMFQGGLLTTDMSG
jgi:3-dehydroquinate synthase